MDKKVVSLIIFTILIALIFILITSLVIVQLAPKSRDTGDTSRGLFQQEKSYGKEIQFKTGPMAPELKTESEIDGFLSESKAQDKSHVILQFSEPLDIKTRIKLQAADINVLDSLGANAFFASINNEYTTISGFQIATLQSVSSISASQKIDPLIVKGKPYPSHAVVSNNNGDPTIAVYALFFDDVSRSQTVRLTQAHQANIVSAFASMNGLVLEMPASKIGSLSESDSVMWIELVLPPLGPNNNENRITVQAEIAQEPLPLGYDLDGSGVMVMVFDINLAWHRDYADRITLADGAGTHSHSIHVAGTIGANGTSIYRGMAPNVSMVSYQFSSSGSATPLYTDPGDIVQDYGNAITEFSIDLASNSLGSRIDLNGRPCEYQGNYGITSSILDDIVSGSLGHIIQSIWSNGNERWEDDCDIEDICGINGNQPCGDYYSTDPPHCAKNIISVGATNALDNTMTSFSSWGPCDDGRMKPDIVAPGCGGNVPEVISTVQDNQYGGGCGTSMAAPTVSGSAALLIQDFRLQFPERDDFLPATLKVLLAHNALDLFNPGPDYKSGYGLLQIADTIDFMRNDSFIEASVNQGETYSFEIIVPSGTSELKGTLGWTDVPGTPNVDPALVNDLDIIAIGPDGTHYPWTLDPMNPGEDALRVGPNTIDNIEQVYVESPESGTWTIEIQGTSVPEGPQIFSVAVSPEISGALIPGDINGDGFVNVLDLIDLLICFGQPALPDCEAEDLNDDGVVNVLDMIEVLINFGAGDFPECNDGNDNDLDNMTDSADPGCWIDPGNSSTYDPQDDDESNCGDNVCEGTETNAQCPSDCPIFECNDGIDNDLDGAIDIADLGCQSPTDNDESNCGDNVCEGTETEESCFEDCSIPAILLVFVTDSTNPDGFLGSSPSQALQNADDICNNDPQAQTGTYKAWLSTSEINARDRIVDGEYRNIFDDVIANNMNDLLDGSLINPIESIELIDYTIWTGTETDGTLSQFNCNDWTSNSGSEDGRVGVAGRTNEVWTSFSNPNSCSAGFRRLYCFQVS